MSIMRFGHMHSGILLRVVFAAALMLVNTAHAQTAFTKITNVIEAANNSTGTYGRIPLGTGAGKGDTNGVLGTTILYDGGTYKMWYVGHDGVNYRIYHATSPDALTWTKMTNVAEAANNLTGTYGRIPLGGSGRGDANLVLRPCVIKDGGTYKMWYSGQDGTSYRIFHATSPDGLTWTKMTNVIEAANNLTGTYGRIPLGGSGRGDATHVFQPRVIKDGNTYKMWYTGANGGTFTIFHATSSDGLTWTKMTNVIEAANNLTGTYGRIPLGGTGKGDVSGVLLLGVIKDDNVYRLWYFGNEGSNWKGIYYATSTDGGLTWTKKNNTTATASDSGPFSNGQIGLGSTAGRGDYNSLLDGEAMRDGAVYRLWYTGRESSTAPYRLFAATAPADHPTIGNVTASVDRTTADLVGQLVATGAAPATVRVFYGTNDAGLAWGQWGTNALLGELTPGVYTQQVASLTPLSTYFYRFYATNSYGEDWSDTAGSFMTTLAPVIENRPVDNVNVVAGTASLNGFLVNTGSAPVTVSVYWGATDGGSPTSGLWAKTNTLAGNAWTNGDALTFTATDLIENRTYYYRFYAANALSNGWAATSESFLAGYLTVTNTDAGAEAPTWGIEADNLGVLTIRRNPLATNSALTLTFALSGTATQGVDYAVSPAGTSVTLPAGVASTNITITPLWNADPWAGPSRTVWLTLLSGVYGIGTPSSNVVTITRAYAAVNHTVAAGNWTNGAVWSLGRYPEANDAVVISNNITLSDPTEILYAFTITNATLTFTNWTTALNATTVSIKNGGILTLPAAFTASQMSNRVWVVSTNFALEKGGQILADAKGFAAQNGPGKGGNSGDVNGSGGGGAYGGKGVRGVNTSPGAAGVPYGPTNAPIEPGSGGGAGANGGQVGGAGGGSVWIDATGGSVTIDGVVSANGTSGASATYGGGSGSGGAIYISCATFAGSTNGLLRANGGTPASGGGAGGGGRIAVDCANLVRENVNVRFTAAGGATASGMGTLYLPDTNLLSETLTPFNNLRIVIPGFTSWQVPYLAISNRVVALESLDRDAFELTVAGDLSITNGGLSLGGQPVSKGVSDNLSGAALNPSVTVGGGVYLAGTGMLRLAVNGDGSPVSLTVSNNVWIEHGSSLRVGGTNAISRALTHIGGALTLTNGGSVWIYSGQTNGAPSDYGALLAVTGAVTVASNSWIYPVSHSSDGGSVKMQAASLAVESGSGINADTRGYNYATGPGRGVNGAVGYSGGGGGYGGRGGDGSGGAGGNPYGSTNAPIAPGSGGGSNANAASNVGGLGGGAVRFEVTGSMTIDGTVTANGGNGVSATSGGGGGSGGAIYLTCASFSGSGGSLLAEGGDGQGTTTAGGKGGGGRIAVAIGLSASNLADLIAGIEIPGLLISPDEAAFSGTLSVTNGAGAGSGNSGTAQFMKVVSSGQNTLQIRGEPATYGVPSPNDYSDSWLLDNGTVFTNSLATPANESNGVRWVSLGWRLDDTDLETLVTSGASTQAVFTVNTNLTLTWLWTNQYQLTVWTGPNGSVNSNGLNGWYTNGVSVPGYLASPASGYYFEGWVGTDVPTGHESQNPLTVTMDRARTNIAAAFASLTGEAKTWTGSGNWFSHTNWSPSGMPGVNDTVTLQSGTATLSEARRVGSLTVNTGASLLFTNWTTCLTADTVTVMSNGTMALPAAFTGSQMSNRVWVICRDFTLSKGGTIQADAKGFTTANGPGRGTSGGVGYSGGGGGYGGRGGDGSGGAGGNPYGSTNAPIAPGSGGGNNANAPSNVGGPGGGAVRIEASGVVTIDGTVTANGGAGVSANYSAGGGSGGAIYVNCATLLGSANGIIRASGGSAGTGVNATGGCGGGGRIAVWIKVPDTMREQYLAGNTNRVFLEITPPATYLGAPPTADYGTYGRVTGVEAGTVYFFTAMPQGSVFMIR